MKSHFHMKKWPPRLALRKRLKVIRKWPIDLLVHYTDKGLSDQRTTAEHTSNTISVISLRDFDPYHDAMAPYHFPNLHPPFEDIWILQTYFE